MMFMTVLVIGALLVGSILTFVALGISNPVPWLFLIAIIAIVLWLRKREKSSFVVWNDEYSVGIKQIDEDHQKLLNLINQFQTAVYYNTGKRFEQESLDELVNYTRTHFAREEKLMQDHDYPDFDAHLAQHKAMIAKVDQFIQAHRDNGHKALQDTADYLRDWLINHINGTDKKYSEYLRSRGVR